VVLLDPAKVGCMIGKAGDAGIEPKSCLMRQIHHEMLVAVALSHDRVDAGLSQGCDARLGMRRILPKLRRDKGYDADGRQKLQSPKSLNRGIGLAASHQQEPSRSKQEGSRPLVATDRCF
jgi:hypothetical protein